MVFSSGSKNAHRQFFTGMYQTKTVKLLEFGLL